MTTSQIEAFLTLCSTLNFTKAATILHTTQPNLSQIIANIEQEIGLQLFVRNKRSVKLTPAGEVFFLEMKDILKNYKNAVKKAQDTSHGIIGTLDIAFLGTALANVLPKLVEAFRQNHPRILLRLYDFTYSSLFESIIEDNVSLAILPDRELTSIAGIKSKLLYSDSMCILVNKNHPLAQFSQIDLNQIAREDFIMMDPLISKRDVKLITDICEENGFSPRIVYEANTLNNLMMMVECSVGISILAKHMEHFATDNIRFIPIKNYENYFRMVCAWKDTNTSLVQPFINIIDELYPQ